MITIDLHTHTNRSDGTLSPGELVRKACDIGLKAIAITDHDTTDGIGEALDCSGELSGLEVIPGTELSSSYRNKEIHIVGLFIEKDSPKLLYALDDLRKKREKRNTAMLKKLRDCGLSLSYDDLLETSGKNVITRAHFAVLLQNAGYVSSKEEAFEKYIGFGKPGYVKRDILSAPDAVSLIKSAGGIPIIAHPFSYGFGMRDIEKMVSDFAAFGAEGMECYYPTHSYEDTVYALSLCRSLGLLPSGGSDFHGENKPGLELGTGYGDLEIPYNILEDMKVKKYG